MSEPQKPFACAIPECGMAFTNEDNLHVHTKKHDMILQLGSEQKNAFVADQTPTPTRFIRNCEEVGLFQDLQNVNPFDEGFKRAMETKTNILSLEAGSTSDDVLHTPQMVFPHSDDTTLYSATNNKNITISRSSSDETGAVKEYETTTISKLTNEVTTISRIIEKQENVEDGNDEKEKVSYNNVIKIQSNLEIRKDHKENNIPMKLLGSVDRQPIMSQKSIDYVVDSLTNDTSGNKSSEKKSRRKKSDKFSDLEVLIKLPNNKMIKMKAVEEVDDETKTLKPDTKEKLKKVLTKKVEPPKIPIAGTLHPVTFINPISVPFLIANSLQKIPIPLNSSTYHINPKVRKTSENKSASDIKSENKSYCDKKSQDDDCFIVEPNESTKDSKDSVDIAEIRSQRSAASKRYRERLKDSMQRQKQENKQLKETNLRLMTENTALKSLLMEHAKKCPNASDLRIIKNLNTAQKRPAY